MEAITWNSILTAGGLGLLLSAVVLPFLKALGVGGRGILVAALLAGQVFAQVGMAMSGTPLWPGVAEAFLLGIVGAAAATGLYEWKEAGAGR